MNAALEGVSGQQHAPAALYPRERPGTHFTWGLVGRMAGLDGRKNLVHTRIRSRTVQPVVSRYTNWATRPTIFNVTNVFLSVRLYVNLQLYKSNCYYMWIVIVITYYVDRSVSI